MTRDELLEPLVTAIRRGTALAGPDIRQFFEDWELVPAKLDGKHVATAALKGTEIHFALVPGWRPRSCYRGVIQRFLEPLLDRHGFLTTRVPHERLTQKKFVQRLGFKPTWRDEHVEFFLLGELPFKRKS